MKKTHLLCASLTALLLAGCASTPMGPTVNALPAQGKPFETFQFEQSQCKQFAADQVRGQAENANERAIGGAVLGTALGAGLGAAVGGGHGAGIGAAAGSLVGGAGGMGYSNHEQKSIQQQYNEAYIQCMYAKGNQIPQAVPATTTVIYQQPAVIYQPAPPPPPTVVYTQPPGVVYQAQPSPPPGY